MAVIRGNLTTTQLLVAHGADIKALSKVLEIINIYFEMISFFSRMEIKHFNN